VKFALAFNNALRIRSAEWSQQLNSRLSTDSVLRSCVFVSYSHRDAKWLERLRLMLSPLEAAGQVVLWDDSRIEAGDKWREEIRGAIASAKVAVLLISKHFLASEFIAKNELPPILDAAEQEGLKVLWVPVSPCLIDATPISRYQAAWNPEHPLATFRGAGADKVLKAIADKIDKALRS
jgi:TIR domain